MRGHSEIAQNSRISLRARGGKVGAESIVTTGANLGSPENKYIRSQNVLNVIFIALTVVPFGTKLLELPVQSPIGSPGTLRGCVFLAKLVVCAA